MFGAKSIQIGPETTVLAHWEAEKTPMDTDLFLKLKDNPFPEWRQIFSVYRTNHPDTGKAVLLDVTAYTLISLQSSFFLFIGVLLLHGITLLLMKWKLSTQFRTASWSNKLQHIVEAVNMPDAYADFDEDNEDEVEVKTPEDYKNQWKSVLKETNVMISLHLFFNLLLLIPIFITGILLSSTANSIPSQQATWSLSAIT